MFSIFKCKECKHKKYKVIAKHIIYNNLEIQECKKCGMRRTYGDILITPWNDNEYISESRYQLKDTIKCTFGTKYLMDKMNEELKAKGYKTKCYRSPLGSWVVEAIN